MNHSDDVSNPEDEANVLEEEQIKQKTVTVSANAIATSSELPASSDSGIGMDLDAFKEQIEKKIESLIDIKLNERQLLPGKTNKKEDVVEHENERKINTLIGENKIKKNSTRTN